MSKGMVEALRYNARVYCSKHEMRSWMEKAADCIEKLDVEREERARGCERCQIFENYPQFLCSRGDGQYDEVIFKYCPVCGRPLKTAMPGEEA